MEIKLPKLTTKIKPFLYRNLKFNFNDVNKIVENNEEIVIIYDPLEINNQTNLVRDEISQLAVNNNCNLLNSSIDINNKLLIFHNEDSSFININHNRINIISMKNSIFCFLCIHKKRFLNISLLKIHIITNHFKIHLYSFTNNLIVLSKNQLSYSDIELPRTKLIRDCFRNHYLGKSYIHFDENQKLIEEKKNILKTKTIICRKTEFNNKKSSSMKKEQKQGEMSKIRRKSKISIKIKKNRGKSQGEINKNEKDLKNVSDDLNCDLNIVKNKKRNRKKKGNFFRLRRNKLCKKSKELRRLVRKQKYYNKKLKILIENPVTRKYYHSISGEPILNEDSYIDSEEELTGIYEHLREKQTIDDFIDICDEEKIFYKSWNDYIYEVRMKYDPNLEINCLNSYNLLKDYIIKNITFLKKHKLNENLGIHLITFYDCGLINSQQIDDLVNLS